MRRSLLLLAATSVALVSPASPRAFADDDAKAQDAFKKLQEWYKAQDPKTPEQRKALRAEVVKRCKQYLKDFPKSGKLSLAVHKLLADVLHIDAKYDEEIAECEELLSSADADFIPPARAMLVRALIDKKDVEGARKRLDAFLKENKDDKNLLQLDDYLRAIDAAKALKPGVDPPAIKGKTVEGTDFSLEALKGKIVLVTFFVLGNTPPGTAKVELPHLKRLYGELHAKGFEVVSIDLAEEDEAKVKDFAEKQKVPWPLLSKDGKAIGRSYGVRTVPRNVLIGKDGKIFWLDVAIGKNEEGKDTFSPDELARAASAAMDGKAYKPKEPPKTPPPTEPGDGEEK